MCSLRSRVLRPNTLYATVALENSVLQGEYYLASHTLMSSLHGLIHGFIMGSSVTFEDNIASMFFIRRMVHYFHNSLVSNSDLDSSTCSNVKKDGYLRFILEERSIPLLDQVGELQLFAKRSKRLAAADLRSYFDGQSDDDRKTTTGIG